MQITPYTPGMTIAAPMLVSGMPNDDYHAMASVSKSGLDLIARSPAHYRFAPAHTATRNMEIGTAIHTALLEPERFAAEYVLLRDVADRRAAAYKAATAVHGTERVLVSHEADDVAGMQESVYANPIAAAWLKNPGIRELSVFATDPETGLPVRCRFDILTECGHGIDLKKTQDAREDAFSRAVHSYRYHVQAAFYSDVYEWATGQRLESFRFLAVEQSAPNACRVYRLDETAIQEGRREYREDLNRFAACLVTDTWPAYECTDDDVISLPEWRIRQIENDLEIMEC